MRALTVKQPWAWAIVHGGKDVENRGWVPTTRHTGRAVDLLIHAGRGVDDVALEGAPPSFPAGVVVAVVAVTSWHRADVCQGRCSPWAEPTGWHWRLTDPRPTPHVAARGQMGLWTPAPAVLERLRAAGVL